jgi:hypothetical protein
MKRGWLAMVLVLCGCVKKPVTVVLPTWIAWCEGATRTMEEPEAGGGGNSTGDYALDLQPCMKVLMDTPLNSAGLVLGVTTNEQGALKEACVKNISFDEPRMLECVMRAVWKSKARLDPNLQRQSYRFYFFLD